MKPAIKNSENRGERGIALLIAIFALLLISGIAVALIMMAGTESAIEGNYRGSTQAFYDSYAGLEEGRGRLWDKNPNAFGAFVAAPGTILPVGQVRYVLNPSAGEVVNPINLTAANPYQDTEYGQEFLTPVTAAIVQATVSTSAVAGLAGPLYKWVRITAKTEQSGGIDVNGDGILNNLIPLFYDGTTQNLTQSGLQVFSVTALAVLPNGSRRLLKYDVAPVALKLSFPSALTLNGPGGFYNGANSNVFFMNGDDRTGTNPPPACYVPPQPPKPAIGAVNTADATNIATNGIPANRDTHYVGSTASPSVSNVSTSLNTTLQSTASLDGPNGLTQLILQNASEVVQGPATSLPDYGTATAPVVAYVNGDLALGSVSGYGILVVTGNLALAGNTNWRGIILVIGQGTMSVSGGGNGEYDGAVLLAKTRDAQGNLLATLGAPLLDWSGGGGNGIYFDSCWINNSLGGVLYNVLSFREITQ